MCEAVYYAQGSPDPSTQNGAVLCHSDPFRAIPQTFAVNRFPDGVHDLAERWERPLKYSVIEHAERNCLYAAASKGISTTGLTMVCPWAACADCARAIIQSGISRLVTMQPVTGDTPDRWDDSCSIGMQMLKESSVKVTYLESPLDIAFTVRRDGKPYCP